MENHKETSWFKLIASSAIGTVVGYFTIILFCCLCYLIFFVIFGVANVQTLLNTANINEDVLNSLINEQNLSN